MLMPIEPMKADFPYARTIAAVRCWRGTKSSPGQPEIRYYLSSMEAAEKTPRRWLELIRGHWGGVENRNHWRRDACLLEDKTRSRNPNIVGALILMRNALLQIYAEEQEAYGCLPAFSEALAANTRLAFRAIARRL
jgi:hypothetical protein